MPVAQDFYEVLGVSRCATVDEIKKAYKKLAIRWHPDKNPEDQALATEMFKAVGEAYETLSDPAKRRDYDNKGSQFADIGSNGADSFGFGSPFSFQQSFVGRPGAGSGSGSFRRQQSSFSDSRAFDIFNEFFAEIDEAHRNFMSGGAFGSGFGDDASNGMFRAGNRHFTGAFRRGGGGSGGGSMLDELLGGGDQFARMQSFDGIGGGVMSSFSSSSFSSSSGGRGGMTSRSVSTSTYIGADGRKVTRKETTVINPDGTRDSSVEEVIDDSAAQGARLGYRDDFGYNDSVSSRDARDRRSLPVSIARDFPNDPRRMQSTQSSSSSKSNRYTAPSIGNSRYGVRK